MRFTWVFGTFVEPLDISVLVPPIVVELLFISLLEVGPPSRGRVVEDVFNLFSGTGFDKGLLKDDDPVTSFKLCLSLGLAKVLLSLPPSTSSRN